MKFQRVTASFAAVVLLLSLSTAKADPIEDLETCRSIVVEIERLACFDAGYDQLRASGLTADSVLKSNVIEVQVPTPVRATQEGALQEPGQGSQEVKKGFGLPFFKRKGAESARDFGRGQNAIVRDSNDRITSITATVVSVATDGLGRVKVTLDNGQVWRAERKIRPKAGDSATIHRGRVGGYFIAVGGKRGIRVSRVDDGKQ